MRDRLLYDALRALTEDASELLEQHRRDGDEVSFEVTSDSAGSGPLLYAYKSLAADFITEHAEDLRRLETFEHAATSVARTRGAASYLRVRGEQVLDVSDMTMARLTVIAFLGAVWDGSEQFEMNEDRFRVAYRELEAVGLASQLVTAAYIPVFGVRLDAERMDLGGGVELFAPDAVEPEYHPPLSDGDPRPDCFCVVSVVAPSDAPPPFSEIRRCAALLLSALRLFKPGSVALGSCGQASTAGTVFPVPIPFTGRIRQEPWTLLPEEQDGLRHFVAAVARIGRRGRIAWSLARFEMGLERSVPVEGLSDHLLAFCGLLESHDDAARAAMPVRVGALCARGLERQPVQRNIELAFALERLAVEGAVRRDDKKELERIGPLAVLASIESQLRALLHDLVCGYLSMNLKDVADNILLEETQKDRQRGLPAYTPPAESMPRYYSPVVPTPVASVAVPEAIPEPVDTLDELLPGVPHEPEPVSFESIADVIEREGAVFDDTIEIDALDIRDEPTSPPPPPPVPFNGQPLSILRPPPPPPLPPAHSDLTAWEDIEARDDEPPSPTGEGIPQVYRRPDPNNP